MPRRPPGAQHFAHFEHPAFGVQDKNDIAALECALAAFDTHGQQAGQPVAITQRHRGAFVDSRKGVG